MAYRFLHTADWQLGKPFAGFGPERAAQLQGARLEIIPKLADLARREGAADVLVAGDVWDQLEPSDALLRRTLDRLGEQKGVRWWLLPGNHDHYRDEGLWQRLQRIGLPPNVELLLDGQPRELAQGVTLLSAPLKGRRAGRDLTEGFEGRAFEGAVIGIAHGGVQAFGSGDDAGVIDAERAEKAGLAYLALGDWHATKQAGPRAFYAGTPEADDFRTTDQGNALIVDLADADNPVSHRISRYTWSAQQERLSPGEKPDELMDRLFPSGQRLDETLMRLTLTGSTEIAARSAVDEALNEAQDRLFHLDLRTKELSVTADAENVEELLGDGVLGRVARKLAAMQDGPDADEARAALRELTKLARQA
ncbi:metallophosphoesterase family protein [Parvularcula maris]|uniref:DNA repair exonuclease n=1 Tax=Parvularcula maris TaxID=2965077 RepID=A0A9X2L997_9PROT|nr:DNA repair exonuclease [Parvularcula maris]MCQ8185468.1 DNA repair exonuclease [Parvularcula maris]